jgi:hypothetical protein
VNLIEKPFKASLDGTCDMPSKPEFASMEQKNDEKLLDGMAEFLLGKPAKNRHPSCRLSRGCCSLYCFAAAFLPHPADSDWNLFLPQSLQQPA